MSRKARIYRPAKNAMQSGRGNTRRWILEFEASEKKSIDPLMGWSGSGDTQTQTCLRFNTMEQAVRYAERAGIPYSIDMPKQRVIRPKSYADNFATNRILQ